MSESQKQKIGFMQGRLSPLVDGKIQAFPWPTWQNEFKLASENGFTMMEWTLDQANLMENPLMNPSGQAEIKDLMQKYNLTIPSLTGDCFMQAPFYKASGSEKEALLQDFKNILSSCALLGIEKIVVPLVDNGSIENSSQKEALLSGIQQAYPLLQKHSLKIVFESDYPPDQLGNFIQSFDPDLVGINYDIGNSAALGYDSDQEFLAYGDRIWNVHVKDRILGGMTCPLGEGHADFEKVFKGLKKISYQGTYILQTARADDNNHLGVLKKYRDLTQNWIIN